MTTERINAAPSLAANTRVRRGTRANVINEVRCDHSELISRTPTMGSSELAGHNAIHMRSWNVRSCGSARMSATTTKAIISPRLKSWSQKPARVSTILRSSTPVRRASPGRLS